MTKITVTDASGTKTVDMVDDTMTLTSTGPAVWSIEADAGDRIQYTRQPKTEPLVKYTEPDIWLLPPPRMGYRAVLVWRVDGVDYELMLAEPEPLPPGSYIFAQDAGVPAIRINPPADIPDGGAAYVKWFVSHVPVGTVDSGGGS